MKTLINQVTIILYQTLKLAVISVLITAMFLLGLKIAYKQYKESEITPFPAQKTTYIIKYESPTKAAVVVIEDYYKRVASR